ncbi:hypothetical protein [Modestobacter lapidis]|nr:hypothetical protein [Modestobacter lapidis]
MVVVTFHTDERSERALAELTADGSTVSEAIRQALVDVVRRRRGQVPGRDRMRRESLKVGCDPVDHAESRRGLAEMNELSAW